MNNKLEQKIKIYKTKNLSEKEKNPEETKISFNENIQPVIN